MFTVTLADRAKDHVMPLDPAVAAIIDMRAQQGRASFANLTIEQIRAGSEMTTLLQKPPQDVATVTDAAYGSQPEQALRIYVPARGSVPRPVVLHYHGGGFCTGSLASIDEPSRALANDLGAVVVAVTYRRAPETKFPGAHEDAMTALEWVAANIAEHGGDSARMATMGDSAGANLAASVAVRARDAGGPSLRAMALLYPMVSPLADTPSRREYAEGYLIDAPGIAYFTRNYNASPEEERDPRMALDRVPSLAGLPATLVLTNEYDMMRDEGEDFARRLAEAGVPVRAKRFDGLTHLVYWMSAAVPRQTEMHAEVVAFLREHLT